VGITRQFKKAKSLFGGEDRGGSGGINPEEEKAPSVLSGPPAGRPPSNADTPTIIVSPNMGKKKEPVTETAEQLKLRKEKELRESILANTVGIRQQSVLAGI